MISKPCGEVIKLRKIGKVVTCNMFFAIIYNTRLMFFVSLLLAGSCNEGDILCDDQRTCIKPSMRCDNQSIDCPDGSDEVPKYCGMSEKKMPI